MGERNDPLSDSPTELGAIAYRIDAIATSIHCLAVAYGIDEAHDLAAKLWGAMDDLVAYGLAKANHESRN